MHRHMPMMRDKQNLEKILGKGIGNIMKDVRVNQITEGNTHKHIGVVSRQGILQHFTLIMTVILSMICVKSVPAQIGRGNLAPTRDGGVLNVERIHI